MPSEYQIEIAEAELRGLRRAYLECAQYAAECGLVCLEDGRLEGAAALAAFAEAIKSAVVDFDVRGPDQAGDN